MPKTRRPKGTAGSKGGQFAPGERPDEQAVGGLSLDSQPNIDFSKGFQVVMSQTHPDGTVVEASGMVVVGEDGTMKLVGAESPRDADAVPPTEGHRKYADCKEGDDLDDAEIIQFLGEKHNLNTTRDACDRFLERKQTDGLINDYQSLISWGYDDPHFGPMIRTHISSRHPYGPDLRPTKEEVLFQCGKDKDDQGTCFGFLTGDLLRAVYYPNGHRLLYKDIKLTESLQGRNSSPLI